MRKLWLGLPLLGCAAAAVLAAQWTIPWEYSGPRGPEHWAGLDPQYAACNGKQQSPIDIRASTPTALPSLRFDYHSGPLRYLINNAHTVRVNYHGADNNNYFEVGGKRYQLTQFHFHHPSEELIKGKQYDMDLHLVHESSDGQTAVVTVLLRAGAPNATVQNIWNVMPLVPGDEHEAPGVQIDPAGLLPSKLDYYTYMGSLTAPPCTEGVVWFILKQPIEVSRAQIDAFAKLYPHDARPVQPLNGRVVQDTR